MASILPLTNRHEDGWRAVQGPSPAALEENVTIFQSILELACRHIDALQHMPVALPLQRSFERQKAARPAECCGDWGESRCLISDFGEGGMAVVCGHPHQIGDVLRIRWKFGHHALVAEVECVVRHVTGMHIGVEFLNVSEGQRARLAASLQYGTHSAAAATAAAAAA